MFFLEKYLCNISALLLCLAIPSSFAAEYRAFTTSGYHIVTVNGQFTQGEALRFERFLRHNPETEYVLLQSHGGYVNEAIKVGRIIQKKKLRTAVETYCNSSCFITLMAGESRHVYREAYVGVHRPFLETKAQTIPDKRNSKTYRNLATYLSGVVKNKSNSQKILDLMYDTPTNNMQKVDEKYDFISVEYYSSPTVIN